MFNRKLTSIVALFIFSVAILPHWVCAEDGLKKTKSPVQVDLRSGIVGGIGRNANLKEIKKIVGEENVKEFTYEAEGDPQKGFEIKFQNGELVKLYWSYFEITSKNFRTKEGLAVGSTWAEFKKAYPDGELIWLPDAYGMWSEKYKFRLHFHNMKEPSLNDPVEEIHVDRSAVSLQ